MSSSYIDILDNFELDSIPNLDVVVLGALELFTQKELPNITIDYTHPLVVGSGNAEATGRVIFEDADAVFGSESNFETKLANIPSIDGVVLISASGSKHAPIIAKKATELGKKVTLITTTEDNPTQQALNESNQFEQFVFPKNREPYTYNTSTYMGMILGKTGEDPARIKQFIEQNIATMDLPDFSRFQKYYIIIPPAFTTIVRMVNVKFIELFGRNIARDVETSEYVRHATTIASSDELFISFGEDNTTWGKPENRVTIPLPDNADYGAMMAISYFVVGQIQKHYEHFFKDNIQNYTAEVSKIFGSTISPIVEK